MKGNTKGIKNLKFIKSVLACLFHGLLNLPHDVMKKITPFSMTIFIVIAVGLCLWMLYGYLSVRNIEEPNFTVLQEKEDSAIARIANIEIRKYDPTIVAETTVPGPYAEAVNAGFRNIADYIFGNNTADASIAMTAPVLQEEQLSEKIAMTTPVLQEEIQDNQFVISFVMPSQYTLISIPKPNSSKVTLREVSGRTVGVITFSVLWTDEKAEKYTETLQTALMEDGYSIASSAQYARYNPPWTPPWMRRNEVWLEVKM